ncbi:MAG: DUF6435 family protein [Pseudomonadota bacterium]|jgi:hypothetical protein|uniref:Lacal_2735 family protein n=2 Tax=Methylophaga TaxID=40222 RepID=F5SZ49_9GAMM|nr:MULTISPECIES: DUF6435 family protein [Methylophaga]MEC9411394.1 DUF6435 family protein [Pseudomonadota bacterium]EGL54572.1 hypothetical protein MAMP_01322 [Methylophaga aminisulfidivorans MP]WVI85745.1 DUF6435 family protein [Methylophaga thalassica]GLQ00927.1 hypothetical protein GCM10007891_27800 [Methylophaga thalassica]HIC46281.1 Lacal_2735 family protein [Methylophaga sp.]
MWSLFKSDPEKKLKKQLKQKREQALHAQRNGDIRLFASLTQEAEAILKQLQQVQSDKA